MRINRKTSRCFSEQKKIRKLQKERFNELKVKIMNSKKYSNSIFKNKTETINKIQVMDSTQVESDEMSLTDKLIRCISENNDRSPRGRRYKKMKKLFHSP